MRKNFTFVLSLFDALLPLDYHATQLDGKARTWKVRPSRLAFREVCGEGVGRCTALGPE